MGGLRQRAWLAQPGAAHARARGGNGHAADFQSNASDASMASRWLLAIHLLRSNVGSSPLEPGTKQARLGGGAALDVAERERGGKEGNQKVGRCRGELCLACSCRVTDQKTSTKLVLTGLIIPLKKSPSPESHETGPRFPSIPLCFPRHHLP